MKHILYIRVFFYIRCPQVVYKPNKHRYTVAKVCFLRHFIITVINIFRHIPILHLFALFFLLLAFTALTKHVYLTCLYLV